ncbi:MAG: HAMP domain-containing protein, partial [Pseudomonadales bacterium]
MKIGFKSLRTRVLFFFVALLTAVQMLAFLLVSTATTEITKQHNTRELTVGKRIFDQVIQQSQNALLQSSAALVSDSRLINAILAGKAATVQKRLKRLDTTADMLIVRDVERNQIAYSMSLANPVTLQISDELAETAMRNGFATDILAVGEQVAQLIAVPIPRFENALTADENNIIGWLIAAKMLDENLVLELQQLTDLQVSLVVRAGTDRATVLHSTRNDSDSTLLDELNSLPVDALSNYSTNSLINNTPLLGDYETLIVPLGQHALSVAVVLQRSMSEAMHGINKLRENLLLLVVLSLLVSLVLGVFMVLSITKPIKKLAEFATEIQRGNYGGTLEIAQQDELGALAYTLN